MRNKGIDAGTADQSMKFGDHTFDYCSKKKFRSMYKDAGGYHVIGAIGAGCKHTLDNWHDAGKNFAYDSIEHNSFLYGIKGYVEVGDNTFVAVMENVLWKRIASLVAAIAIVVALLLGGYLLNQSDGPEIDGNSSKYNPKIVLPEKSNPDTISLPGYGDINMFAGTSDLKIALWNPETNQVYFKFTILLEDTEEKLYESKFVEPGNAITEVKLSRALEQGIHPVIVRIDTFDINDYKVKKNGGEAKARVIALEKGE